MTLSVVELIVLFFCAILVGITINFFFSTRKNMKMTSEESDRLNRNIDDWKAKYFNDIDDRDKEMLHLKQSLEEAEENARDYRAEAENMHRENRQLEAELEQALNQPAPALLPQLAAAPLEKSDYIQELRLAHSSLLDHNEKINRLLEQIDVIKEKEEQQQIILEEKEQLSNQLNQLKTVLSDKDREISSIREKGELTKEMGTILDNAYGEFNVLQNKIQKLELQLNQSKLLNIEYEDLKESHYKLIRDFEEQKARMQGFASENQHLSVQMEEATEKLRDAGFQRQQLQKRISYLEELNSDLHVVADANKKLEGQLKRIGELESRLNVVSEDKDDLLKKEPDNY